MKANRLLLCAVLFSNIQTSQSATFIAPMRMNFAGNAAGKLVGIVSTGLVLGACAMVCAMNVNVPAASTEEKESAKVSPALDLLDTMRKSSEGAFSAAGPAAAKAVEVIEACRGAAAAELTAKEAELASANTAAENAQKELDSATAAGEDIIALTAALGTARVECANKQTAHDTALANNDVTVTHCRELTACITADQGTMKRERVRLFPTTNSRIQSNPDSKVCSDVLKAIVSSLNDNPEFKKYTDATIKGLSAVGFVQEVFRLFEEMKVNAANRPANPTRV